MMTTPRELQNIARDYKRGERSYQWVVNFFCNACKYKNTGDEEVSCYPPHGCYDCPPSGFVYGADDDFVLMRF